MRQPSGARCDTAAVSSPDQHGRGAAAAAAPRKVAGITYLARRSRRAHRLRLTIGGDGVPLVTLPQRAPLSAADAFVVARRDWVERHAGLVAERRARHAARGPLGDGRVIDLRGQPHRLEVRVLPAPRRRSRIEHDDQVEPVLRAWLASDDPRSLAAVLETWLRAQAREAVVHRVAARAPQLGVTPVGVAIRDQRSRWGSASRHGRLSFSWRLILAPPAVLDYVVVHELAHLADFSHSPEYWRLVRGVVPEADRACRWLREHAWELHWSIE